VRHQVAQTPSRWRLASYRGQVEVCALSGEAQGTCDFGGCGGYRLGMALDDVRRSATVKRTRKSFQPVGSSARTTLRREEDERFVLVHVVDAAHQFWFCEAAGGALCERRRSSARSITAGTVWSEYGGSRGAEVTADFA